MNARLVLALTLAIASIAAAAVFIREAAPTPPLTIAALRLLLAGALVTVPLWRRVRAIPPTRALIGGVLYAVHFGTWIASLWLTSLAASTTLVTASPLFLAAHGAVTGTDPPPPALWAALLVALAGVAFIALGASSGHVGTAPLLGNLLALTGALAMAAWLLLCRRLGPTLDAPAFGAAAALVAGILLAALVLATGGSLAPASATSWAWIALAALVPQVVGHTLMTWSLRHTTPTVVGLMTLGEPVVTTALGAWLYGEIPGSAVLLGCGLTLVAVVATLRVRRG